MTIKSTWKEQENQTLPIHKAEYLDVEQGCWGEIFSTVEMFAFWKKKIADSKPFHPLLFY